MGSRAGRGSYLFYLFWLKGIVGIVVWGTAVLMDNMF